MTSFCRKVIEIKGILKTLYMGFFQQSHLLTAPEESDNIENYVGVGVRKEFLLSHVSS